MIDGSMPRTETDSSMSPRQNKDENGDTNQILRSRSEYEEDRPPSITIKGPPDWGGAYADKVSSTEDAPEGFNLRAGSIDYYLQGSEDPWSPEGQSNDPLDPRYFYKTPIGESDIDMRQPDIKIEPPEISGSFDSSHEVNRHKILIGSGDDPINYDLSSDSSLGDIEYFDLDNKIRYEISTLVLELAISYRTQAADRQSTSEGRSNATVSNGSQFAHPPTAYLSKRRRHAEKNNENSDDEESPNSPSKRRKQNKGEGQIRYLACPFARNDPRKHGACFSNRLSRIRDVKQHLVRKHTPGFYCSRCLVIFTDQSSHELHTGNAAGLFCKPSSRLDGISQSQRSQLSRKSNPKLSEEEQWLSIWDEVRKIVADRLDLVFKEWQSSRSVNLISYPEIPSPNSQGPYFQSPRINTLNSPIHNSIEGGSQDIAGIDHLSFQLPTDNGSLETQPEANGDFDFNAWWEDLANQNGDLAGLNSYTSANFYAALGFANSNVTGSTEAHDTYVGI